MAEDMIIVVPTIERAGGVVWKNTLSNVVAKTICVDGSMFNPDRCDGLTDLDINGHRPSPGGLTLQTHGQQYLKGGALNHHLQIDVTDHRVAPEL